MSAAGVACATALALAGALACGGEPTGPGTPVATPLTLGSETAGSVAAGGTRTYAHRTTQALAVSISLSVQSGVMRAELADSATGTRLALLENVGTPGLLYSKSEPAWVESGRTLRVTVSASSQAGASFRLTLFREAGGPESHPMDIAVGDTVVETIDAVLPDGAGNLIETDLFYLQSATDSQEIVIAAERDIGMNCQLDVLPDTGFTSFHTLNFTLTGLPLGAQTSTPFRLGAAGRYRVKLVCRKDVTAVGGTYRFAIRAVDRRPEGRSASVVTGDTVTESIAFKGDYDTYSLSAVQGAEVKLMLQMRGVSGRLAVNISGPDITPIHLEAGAADSFLVSRLGSGFRFPSSGPYTITIGSSDFSSWGADAGGYRFVVYPVHRQPETASATIAVGDTTADEPLPNGDIDEFQFALAQPTWVNVELLRTGTGTNAFQMELNEDGTPEYALVVPGYLGQAPLDRRGTGTRLLPTGTYTLRVQGYVVPEHPYTGTYRIHVVAVDTAPEGRGASFAIGEEVSGTLTPADRDVYALAGTAGQRLVARLTLPPNAGRTGKLGLLVGDYPDHWLGQVEAPAVGGGPDTLRTLNFILPAGGTYRVMVYTVGDGTDPDEYGDYRFSVQPYSPLPEHLPATIAVGDSFVGERIDEPADVDSFLVAGTAGQEIVVLVPDTTLRLEADVDGALAYGRSPGTSELGLGRIVLPASGQLGLRIRQGSNAGAPYAVQVYAVDRAPEDRAAAFQFGDSVASRIERVGDWDDFTVTAAAGDSVAVEFGAVGVGSVVMGVHEMAMGGERLAVCLPSGCAVQTWTALVWTGGTQHVWVRPESDRVGTPGYWFRIRIITP